MFSFDSFKYYLRDPRCVTCVGILILTSAFATYGALAQGSELLIHVDGPQNAQLLRTLDQATSAYSTGHPAEGRLKLQDSFAMAKTENDRRRVRDKANYLAAKYFYSRDWQNSEGPALIAFNLTNKRNVGLYLETLDRLSQIYWYLGKTEDAKVLDQMEISLLDQLSSRGPNNPFFGGFPQYDPYTRLGLLRPALKAPIAGKTADFVETTGSYPEIVAPDKNPQP